MKELNGVACNILLAASEKDCRLTASVEIILIVNEPAYQEDVAGLVATRPLEALRFAVNVAGMRVLVKKLLAIADDAEALEKRAHLDLPAIKTSAEFV